MDRNGMVMTALQAVMSEYAAGNSPLKKYKQVIDKMEKVSMTNSNAFQNYSSTLHKPKSQQS